MKTEAGIQGRTQRGADARRDGDAALACPVCGAESSSVFWEIRNLPVKCNALCSTREEALGVPRADVRLAVCRSCGYIWNTSFDSARMEYDPTYENALHFSPRFRSYAEDLAHRLVEDYDLRGKDILEIACGDGYFLRLLCAYGPNRGVGFDPSYTERPSRGCDEPDVSIVQDYYGEKYADRKADLVCCRHALEHMPDPVAFLRTIRRTIGSRRDTVVFFELPNAMFILHDLSVWDIIYEHCCYFTMPSLIRCFETAGFVVESVREAYDGQFLTIVARPTAKGVKTVSDGDRSTNDVVDAALVFAGRFSEKLDRWAKEFTALAAGARKAVLWGAGSKGITILNMLQPVCGTDGVKYVVDINDRKHGKFVAGTGQEIVPPEFLKKCLPDVVVVMNPVYEREICRLLSELGVTSEVSVA